MNMNFSEGPNASIHVRIESFIKGFAFISRRDSCQRDQSPNL